MLGRGLLHSCTWIALNLMKCSMMAAKAHTRHAHTPNGAVTRQTELDKAMSRTGGSGIMDFTANNHRNGCFLL